MSEVMVDFTTFGQDQEAQSGYSGVSSTLARSTADRSGTEMVTSDYVINREAYFASGEASYETTSASATQSHQQHSHQQYHHQQ
jgi:hypothetical protein